MYALAHPAQSDQNKLWLAIAVSLAVHLSFFLWWPHSKLTIPPLEKITINLSVPPPAAKPAAPPPPAQPKVTTPQPVTPPKPATPKVERPVLSAPSSNNDYTVAEKPAEPVTPSPVETKAAAVEAPSNNVTNSKPTTNTTAAPTSITSVTNTNNEEANSSEAWDGYGKDLYDLVGKSKTYPAMAIRRHWEGEVKVRAKFVLGKLQDIVILNASGHAVLDTAAIEMVTKAINQLPVKGVLSKKSFTVEIPVSFKLEA